MAVSAVVRLLELAGLFASALLASRGAVAASLVAAGITGAAVVLHGVLRASLTELVRRTLFRALSESLLGADVLDDVSERGHETEPLVYQALFDAIRLCASTAPALCGEIVASAALTIFIVVAFPGRLLGAVALATIAAMAVLLSTHRVMRGTWEREGQAFQAVADGLVCAFRGRLEIVASGRDVEFLELQEARTTEWSRRSRAAATLAAVTARAPLVVAGLIGALVLVGPPLLETGRLKASEIGMLLVVASAAPAFAAAIRDAADTLRTASRVDPLVALLRAERASVGVARSELPNLPATIKLEGVSFAYRHSRKQVLRELDCEWKPGEVLVFAGPNGSGKSTVLRLLLGLVRATHGRIEVASKDLHSLDLRAWRKTTSFVPQRPFWPDNLSVRDVFRLTIPQADDESIESALRRFGVLDVLASRSQRRPLDLVGSTLSAGERQRVILARAWSADTPILLLDEPDTNLDAAGIDLLVELVRSREGRAVAIAAHHPALVAVGDKVIRLGAKPAKSTDLAPAPTTQAEDRD
jgi:ABC-type transport system involved in cytochrome bd biosynthesis fused ATPase/permease subunit